MGRVYPLNDSHHYASPLVYPPCASHYFPALSEMAPTTNFRESATGLDRAPLGLFVNLRGSASSLVSHRELLDGLIQEIFLRSNSRNKRDIQSLQVRLPLKPLDSAQITELVYHLSRHFRLAHGGQHHFSAMLPLTQANDATLALLKGLGFSQLVFEAVDALSTATLTDALTCATDYHFDDVALQLTALDEAKVEIVGQFAARDASSRLHHIELDLPPQSWNCSGSIATQQDPSFQQLFNILRQEGYRVIGNDCFVLSGHRFAKGQMQHTLRRTPLGYNTNGITDICGLGPGSITRENNHLYRNIPSVQGYLQRLQEHQSPVSHVYNMTAQQKLLQLVIDELLCFHTIDLDYLASRYRLDTEALVETLGQHSRGMAPDTPWFTHTANQLTLTSPGIFQLHHLAHLVSQYAGHCCPA